MKDLIILVADKSMEYTLKGVLGRSEALGIRPVTFDILVHPERDPGCAHRGVGFLDSSGFSNRYYCGLLVFDYEGCGKEQLSPPKLQENLNEEFAHSNWNDRAKAIVIVPELEAWLWRDSRHLEEVVGWKTEHRGLYRWLRENDWLKQGNLKPNRPKEAFEATLRKTKKRRSSSLYLQIAQTVSLAKREDKSFQSLIEILRAWFPTVG